MPADQKKEKIAEDRALLNEQNKEYAESLAKDLAKKEEKERVRVETEKREQRKRTIHEYRENLKDVVFSGSHRVMVRYPNGARAVLGFSPSDRVERLFDAIFSNPACPDYFSVRSVYPRAQILCFPGWYREVFNAEVDEESRVPKENGIEMKSFEESIIANNSILFINTIH
ncbi:unnamed protein product [Caenorhabditis sp. 36 PRJEB53466]|nr:unnamed protein product [Caenorhabditis sp. 36 PRJEB53466]